MAVGQSSGRAAPTGTAGVRVPHREAAPGRACSAGPRAAQDVCGGTRPNFARYAAITTSAAADSLRVAEFSTRS